MNDTVKVTDERAKKLTVERIAGKAALIPQTDPDAAPVWLADIYCYVTGNKIETSAYGDYSRWLGEFKSENLVTGEVLTSANAIFPSIASDMIEAAYVGGNKIGGESANVLLAFRIGIKHPLRPNKAGYEYTIKQIVAAASDNPLDRLIADAKAMFKQIEGEKPQEETPSKKTK